MATSGAQPGNNNATKNRPWAEAIRRAMARAEADGNYKSLNALADRLLEKAAEGDMAALKELGDRLDGRPAQAIVGDAEQPIAHTLTWMTPPKG